MSRNNVKEGAGAVWTDRLENLQDVRDRGLTVAGTPTFEIRARGVPAMYFGGSADLKVSVMHFPKAYPFTIECFVRTTATSGRIIAFSKTSVGNVYFLLDVSSGNIRLLARNTTTYAINGGAVNDGDWHHVAGVFTNATSRELFLDGVSQGTSTDSVTLATDIDAFGVANYHTTNLPSRLVGAVADAAVWWRALTQPECLAIATYQL